MLNFFQNKNQIVLISLEFSPLVKAGLKGNYNRDFLVSLKKLQPNKDIRVIIPYYDNDIFKTAKDTGIEFDFNYGVQTSKAEVFKMTSDDITVYCIKSDVFSNFKSPCEIKNFDLLKASSAFSSSAIIALEELSKDCKENFNPNVIHLIDWQTSLNGKKRTSSFLKNKKIIHTIHNFKSTNQGNIMPFYGMLLFFEKNEIEHA
ncbi:MAG: glycogen/starch synthase, partial [Candidatus Gastranaerophilales bacterium]|nr:glycogen/starch synthase [Candidatus Gastranaerophilales bacterium]